MSIAQGLSGTVSTHQCDMVVMDWSDTKALPMEKLSHLLQPFGENLSLLLLPLGSGHDYAYCPTKFTDLRRIFLTPCPDRVSSIKGTEIG